MKRTIPIVTWPGGKSSLLKYLLPLVPADAKCYVEVFGGGAALLLAKPRHTGQAEVYNDANSDLVNAFRQAKHHHEELIRALQWMPNSRTEMMRHKTDKGLTEIQRAAIFLHDRLISFGGDGSSYGVQKQPGGGAFNSRQALEARLLEFAARMDRVSVENLDWQRCLKLYDKESTFFFLDPPYIGGQQKAYSSWTIEDFRKFAEALATLKGRWMLTVNDSPDLRTLFKGCRIKAVGRSLGIAVQHDKKACYHELIITP